jgi:hypothetical protein
MVLLPARFLRIRNRRIDGKKRYTVIEIGYKMD